MGPRIEHHSRKTRFAVFLCLDGFLASRTLSKTDHGLRNRIKTKKGLAMRATHYPTIDDLIEHEIVPLLGDDPVGIDYYELASDVTREDADGIYLTVDSDELLTLAFDYCDALDVL